MDARKENAVRHTYVIGLIKYVMFGVQRREQEVILKYVHGSLTTM